jgi:hypothetical protein
MPTYYVQKFTNNANGGDTKCYGAEDSHNHDRSNQFTTDIKDWLTGAPANWNRADINTGPFLSGQSEPDDGRKFKWNDTSRKWAPA